MIKQFYGYIFRYFLISFFFLIIPVLLLAQLNPLQLTGLELAGQDVNWNYNMGYRFTVNQDGQITQLGGRWTNGISHTVRLYSYPSGNVIASVSISGNINWAYADITPVNVLAGEQYVVAVRLNSQSSGAYSNFVTPVESAAITIENSVYRFRSNNMPNSVSNSSMYGQADITFEPCSYAGILSATKTEVIKGDSTVLNVSSNIGSIQWQSSVDNINFSDIIGETSTILNTGRIDTPSYFRTYITGGSCASDTSSSLIINVIESFYPLRITNPEITGKDINWNYNMGYRFTAEQDGQITHLGGRWTNGVTQTVRLYAYPSGTVLGTVNISGTSNWNYGSITPINVSTGQQYVVAVRLNSQSSGYYSQFTTPISSAGINITNGTYLSNSNSMPTNSVTNYMYGLADIKFVPCDFAGTLLADNYEIETGDSTNINVTDNTGNIQWQISNDNITYADISGANGTNIKTGALYKTTFYRTVITTPTCGGDTSNIITIIVKDPLRPLQYINPVIASSGNNWNYNMGYRFTAEKNGNVTELGGRWKDGISHTVRLYSYPSGTLLASSNVVGSENWAFNTITPVNLTAGQQYVVATRLDAQSSGVYSLLNTPVVSGEITIDNATYLSNSNNMPTNVENSLMYGQADIKFIPCVSGGVIAGNDNQICSGSATTIASQGAEGNLQWQASNDKINFSNINGETDSILNTSNLFVKTYYRLISSASCGNDTSNIDSVLIIGGGGGTPWLWTAAVSQNWSDACNWSNGLVPVNGDSAIIPSSVAVPQNIPTVSLSYLEINNVSGITLSNDLTIENELVLNVGNLYLGNNNLILEANAIITNGYSTSYIAGNSNGIIRKKYIVADGSSFTLPIGDGNNFAPITFSLNSASLGANPYIEFKTINSIHPAIGTPNAYIKRYWTLASNNITNINYDINCVYASIDIVGTEANMFTQLNKADGSWQTLNIVDALNNIISGTNITEIGDITASDIIPIVTAQSGDWNNPTTWLGGVVPTILNNATILNTHNITLTTDVNINSLIINTGGTFDLGNNRLNASGDIAINGTINTTSGTVNLNGTVNQTFLTANDIIFNNLIVNNSAGVNINSGVNFQLKGVLTLTSGVLDVSSTTSFTLISDASSTAIIDGANNTGTIVGNVTVQRYIDGLEGFRYLSSPVLNQTIADWIDNFDIAASGGTANPWGTAWSSVQTYDETLLGANDTGWTNISSVSDIINRGEGYGAFIFGSSYIGYGLGPNLPATVDVTGSVDLGPVDYNITYTNFGNALADGWILIGNPYPSTLDWDNVAGWTKTNMNNAIYVWRSDLMQYTSYVDGIGINGGNRYINSGQGFMVKAIDGTSALSVNRNATNTSSTGVFYKQSKVVVNPILRIKLDQTEDETLIRLHNESTDNFDNEYDAYKMTNKISNKPELSTLISSNLKLSINSLPMSSSGHLSIPLFLKSIDNVNREFDFNGIHTFPEQYCIKLEDKYLNKWIDLREDSIYSFVTVNDSLLNDINRFIIHFTEVKALFDNLPNEITVGDTISLNNNSINAINYNWDFANGNISNAINPILVYDNVGEYNITLTASNGTCSDIYTKTLMVNELTFTGNVLDEKILNVYPDPFTDILTIEISSMEQSSDITIYDELGRAVYKSNNIQLVQKIDLSALSNGVYYLNIVSDEQSLTKKIIKQ